MSCYIEERGIEIPIAKELWLHVVKERQLNCFIKDYQINQFTSRLCYLTMGNLTVRGVGKGRNSFEIDISASFEALEYHLSSYCFHNYPIIFGSPLELSKDYFLFLDRCNAKKIANHATKNSLLPWVIYENIRTKDQHAIPLATVDLFYQANTLTKDTFNYTNCSFYAASNGLSSGASYEESVIHGALELIERDAYSYFLIDTYILNKSPIMIKIETLPDDLIFLTNKIEENYSNKVIILQMPSRFGVYVFLATFQGKVFGIQPRGAGASLNAKHALERALHELVQTYNLMYGSYIENKIIDERLDNNSLIKKFLEFDSIYLLKQSKFIEFEDNTEEIKDIKLSEYYSRLVELIYHESSLLVNTVYQNKNSLTCTRVIIPDAEEFFLATHYLKLEPKPKTQLYITHQSGKDFTWNKVK